MKKWNTPAIAELSLEATENGFFPFLFESCVTHGIGCGCNGDHEDGNKGEEETPKEDDGLAPDTLS